MNTTKQRNWLPILLIGWNVFDVVLHLRLRIIEPLRLTGNAVGIGVAVLIMAGFGRKYAPHLLALSAVTVLVLSTIFFSQVGFRIPSLIFIGTHLFMLIRWAQNLTTPSSVARSFYQRRQFALICTVTGVLVIALAGLVFA